MREYCNCELCGKRARTYCESDKAKLCWDCDEKVHGANFLVAKHSRCLLCQSCQSQTPWKASGPKLLPTVSFCEGCGGIHKNSREPVINDLDEEVDKHYKADHASSEDDDNHDVQYSSGSDYEEDEYGDDDEKLEEEGDNQVVPLASGAGSSPAHVLSGTNSDEEILFKRLRESSTDTEFSDDEMGGSSLQTLFMASANYEVSSMSYLRPLKQPRRTEY